MTSYVTKRKRENSTNLSPLAFALGLFLFLLCSRFVPPGGWLPGANPGPFGLILTRRFHSPTLGFS